MDFKLKGKTALVTGSSKSIGFATASLLAQEGAKVFINGRTEQSVNAVLIKQKQNQETANVIGMAGKQIHQGYTYDVLSMVAYQWE